MISTLTLKFGRSPNAQAQPISATPVTVFVGPNNSGKSKILAEIDEHCRTGVKSASAVVLSEIAFPGSTQDEATAVIDALKQFPVAGETLAVDHVVIGSRHGRMHVHYERLVDFIKSPASNLHAYCQWFLTHITLMLDGRNRINLTDEQDAGDLQLPGQTSLQVLFRDDAKRLEVRRIISEAFGSFFVIDPTKLGKLRIRLSQREPASEMEERGIHSEAAAFHADAQSISQASDGVKAFCGIITETIAGDPKILLVDEPEAFLHPSLAAKLGYEVSRAALSSNKRVFASTHSPTFVMGCIQSGAPINIIRLTYRGGVATARLLPSCDLLELMRNPLLRSTGVLSGLFYEFVVVTESDADRAFYQEVNERLLRFNPDWGIPNCLFINAQNKQTIHTIMRPLRQLGIPTVGIVDIDALKDGGATWTNLLSAASVPEISRPALATLRSALKSAMDQTGKDMKRDGGIAILRNTHQEAARNLLDQLADYGIFVVPGGELESWVKSLGAAGHGPGWLISVFEKMGEDPESTSYVKPTSDDVWAFMRSVKSWLVNVSRKGIPE